ncbi:alpha/beta hydrolase [Umezawaea sp.]|uniref:alpha/beta fold hydrolase n=1 Tax=Umezawaea sp. TaxID=1955258 RepID=UPI002ED5C973
MNPLPSGLRWQAFGSGGPTTLIVHGLGATAGEARIPASGLPGTRVIVTLPSHSGAADAPDGYWTYPRIARDLWDVAQEVGATRAIGVSLGAGALVALLASRPDAFERVALLLPATLDRPRPRQTVEDLVNAVELPEGVDAGAYLQARAAAFRRLSAAVAAMPGQVSVAEPGVLARVTAPVLVVAATDDPLHPEPVAKAMAAAFPAGVLEVYPSRTPLVTHRRELRALLVDFTRV